MPLTPKQRRFTEEYCVDFNATQAAIRAGYSKRTAYSQGQRLLKHVEIKEAIDKRMDELAMSASEALMRLTQWGRGTVDPFLRADEDGNVYINLGSEGAKENYHLIRKIKQTKATTRFGEDGEREEVRTEFELYDAKDAVKEIAKIRDLYGDNKRKDRS